MSDTTAEKPFRFLDLPPELKNRIYCLLLENDGPVEIKFYASEREANNIQPAILRTCRQIRDEATAILYANNAFKSVTELAMQNFMVKIGDSVEHLRHVEIYRAVNTKAHFRPILLMLKRAKWLTRFEIGGLQWTYGEPEMLAKELGPVIRALHKARKQKKDYTLKNVLDVLVVHKRGRSRMDTDERWEEMQRQSSNEEYETRVKEIIGTTLK